MQHDNHDEVETEVEKEGELGRLIAIDIFFAFLHDEGLEDWEGYPRALAKMTAALREEENEG